MNTLGLSARMCEIILPLSSFVLLCSLLLSFRHDRVLRLASASYAIMLCVSTLRWSASMVVGQSGVVESSFALRSMGFCVTLRLVPGLPSEPTTPATRRLAPSDALAHVCIIFVIQA